MKYNHKQAFACHGTSKHNQRGSHCAMSRDNKRLAITCWADHMQYMDGKVIYEDYAKDSWPGRELLAKLRYANDNLNGELFVVEAVAEDVAAEPRKIKECYPRKFVMHLVHLDLETGYFKAESKAA